VTRDRIAISVVAAAAVVAAFWFAILAPKREDVRQADAALATQRDRLDRAQATAAKARAARASYSADYSAVVMLGKAVPAQNGLPSLLYQIDGSARGAKVDFSSVTSGTGPADTAASGSGSSTPTPATGTTTGASSTTAPTPVPLSFVFSGSFLDMEHMLARVHDFVRPSGSGVAVSGRLLSVDDISLQPASGGGLARVQATVNASAYTMPAPTTAADGTAAPAGGTAAPASATATTTTTTASGSTP
jgi:Tfp pilus assembly protein PilO